MPAWSPESWNSFGVVGLVVFMGVVLFWSLITERLVIGKAHREAIATKDATIADLRKSGETKDGTINTLTTGLLEATVRNDTETRMLTAFREAVKGGA